MGMLAAGNVVANTNTLLIKHGRGNSVGLWKDTKNRYGYFKIPSGYELVIDYAGANCKYLEAGNYVTVIGGIGTAKVGNTAYCEGLVVNANVGNVCYRGCDVEVYTVEEKMIKLYVDCSESIKRLGEGLPDQEKLHLFSNINKRTNRKAVTIRLRGDFDKIVIQEPSGVAVEVVVKGNVKNLIVKNCLQCRGTIQNIEVQNCLKATTVQRLTGNRYK